MRLLFASEMKSLLRHPALRERKGEPGGRSRRFS